DLRVALEDTRVRRPLDLIRVTHGRRRVKVALDRPAKHQLAGLLRDLTEPDERPVGRNVSSLLFELTSRHRLALLAWLDFALRARPMAEILLRPEGAALMREQHLQATLPLAPEQDPRARAPRLIGLHASRPLTPPAEFTHQQLCTLPA